MDLKREWLLDPLTIRGIVQSRCLLGMNVHDEGAVAVHLLGTPNHRVTSEVTGFATDLLIYGCLEITICASRIISMAIDYAGIETTKDRWVALANEIQFLEQDGWVRPSSKNYPDMKTWAIVRGGALWMETCDDIPLGKLNKIDISSMDYSNS